MTVGRVGDEWGRRPRVKRCALGSSRVPEWSVRGDSRDYASSWIRVVRRPHPDPPVHGDHDDFERERTATQMELGPAACDGYGTGFAMIEHGGEDAVQGRG